MLRALAVATLLIAAIFGGIYWKSEQLKQRLVREIIARIQPHVPFRIESVTLDAGWRDLRAGRIRGLRIVIDWPETKLRASIDGPIEARLPMLTFEPTIRAEWNGEKLPALPIRARATLTDDLTGIIDSSFTLDFPSLELRRFGAELKTVHLEASGREGKIQAAFSTAGGSWADPKAPDARMAEIKGFNLTAGGTYSESPFRLAPHWKIEAGAGAFELLHDELYLNLPLEKVPISISADVAARSAALTFPRGNATVARRDGSITIDGALGATAIVPLLDALQTSSPVAALSAFQWKAGTLAASVKLELPDGASPRASGKVDLRGVAFERPDLKLALKGAELSARATVSGGKLRSADATASVAKGKARRVDFALEPTKFVVKDGAFVTSPRLALSAYGSRLPLTIGEIRGTLAGDATTSLSIGDTSLHPWLAAACLPDRGPESRISANFPTLRLSSREARLSGEATARFLGGRLVVRDPAIQRAGPFVEARFDSEWDALQLDQLGRELHFGKMDGVLTGHAKKVLLRDWRPVEYDFLLRAKPRKKRDIVFSPRAMNNMIQLIVGEDVFAKLPGIFRGLMFGKISGWLGGYDVYYAGLSLFAKDGMILVETLDPPKIVQSEGKHFILYGGRIKMPLNVPTYPFVLDSAGVDNLVRQLVARLKKISTQEDDDDYDLPEKDGTSDGKRDLPDDPNCATPRVEDL